MDYSLPVLREECLNLERRVSAGTARLIELRRDLEGLRSAVELGDLNAIELAGKIDAELGELAPQITEAVTDLDDKYSVVAYRYVQALGGKERLDWVAVPTVENRSMGEVTRIYIQRKLCLAECRWLAEHLYNRYRQTFSSTPKVIVKVERVDEGLETLADYGPSSPRYALEAFFAGGKPLTTEFVTQYLAELFRNESSTRTMKTIESNLRVVGECLSLARSVLAS